MLPPVTLLAAVLCLVETAACAPPPPPISGYCSTGIYKHLLPLSDFPPAQAFCSSKFPIPPKTVTETKTTTVAKPKRSAFPEHGVRRGDPRSPLMDELQGLNKNMASSACACIQTTPTVTVSLPSHVSRHHKRTGITDTCPSRGPPQSQKHLRNSPTTPPGRRRHALAQARQP